ncbi:MAG: phosphoribosylamine--glycine ligase [Christensenellales bacterium]|jgi:phosphoribosylamine--glycine ligase
MKVLVIGGGGREHALINALKKSPSVSEIYCAPGNGGIARAAACVPIGATDIEPMVRFAVNSAIDFCIVTPDDPLALGMVDAMERAGIASFGPDKKAAELEGSKVFAKNLMRKYGIPTAAYQVFGDAEDAKAYIERAGAPIVVKADGLAKGKGVIIAGTVEEAKSAVDEIMSARIFGDAGNRVVVEECISGPEVSVMCFADGERLVPMVSCQDHKRVRDGDKGPNTGGMGAFSPSPHYTPEVHRQVMETILLPTLRAMKAEGRPFKGILYAGLMLTEKGPMTLEFNVRFGDPETQAVLPLLESDLMDILIACRDGHLDKVPVDWRGGAAAVVVMASGGYPGSYEEGFEITGLEAVDEAQVVHAGTREENGKILTAGGRVLGVSATGDTLKAALDKCYQGVEKIHFEGAHYRADIGRFARED